MKNLIVYYSRTGNTEKVAEEINEILEGEMEEIIDRKNRNGFFGFLIGGFDAFREKETDINPISHDLSKFDRVIIGTPIWAGKMVPAVRTFINKFKKDLKNIGIFTTASKEKGENIREEIEEITCKNSIPFLSVLAGDFYSEDYKHKIRNFTEEIEVE